MKFSKKLAATTLLTVAALAFAGCAQSGAVSGGEATKPAAESGGGSGDDAMEIALIAKGFQHQFWQAVKKGAEDKAAELGATVTFEAPATETEVDNQLNMLRTAIDRKPDAIGFAALDPEACVPLYEQAEAAGIPIIEFDAPCSGSDYAASLAATDNVAAAATAADHMAELIGGAGEVAIVGHSQAAGTGADRRDGFVEQMESKYPDIEIVDIQYGDGDHLKSADIAKAIIAAHPDLKGIFGTNEGSAIGVVNAVTELGLEPGKIKVIGFDSGTSQIEAIKSGVMAGAVTQDPIGIGANAVEAAIAAAKGEKLEKFTDSGSHWFDKDNIDDPEIAALLYQ